MRIIEKLVDHINEELEGAETYAKCALKYKDDHPHLAKVFFDMSNDEMRHVHLLHEEVVALIDEHKRTKGEPPVGMMAIWDYVHRQHIAEANEVKMLQSEFTGR